MPRKSTPRHVKYSKGTPYHVEARQVTPLPRLLGSFDEGYHPDVLNPTDDEIARLTVCPNGHPMTGTARVSDRSEREYHAFAICRTCGIGLEF